jgi:hypothetical protein
MKNQYSYHLKKYLAVLILLLAGLSSWACDACKKQQPKLLQNITHGKGPDSNWDYLIVAVMVVITLYVLVATIKCLVKPAEQQDEHIKRMILND